MHTYIHICIYVCMFYNIIYDNEIDTNSNNFFFDNNEYILRQSIAI